MLDQIQAGLVKKNFAVVAKTQITNEQVPYHVTVTKAVLNQLFVHFKGKAAFVEINQTTDYRDKTERTWLSLKFTFSYISEKELLKLCFNKEKYDQFIDSWDFMESRGDYHDHIIPGYNAKFTFDPLFKNHSGYCSSSHCGEKYESSFSTEQVDSRIPLESADVVVNLIDSVINQVMPYLAQEFHHSSHLGCCFAPEYQFPNCEELFSQQFDWQYFRQLFGKKPAAKRRLY